MTPQARAKVREALEAAAKAMAGVDDGLCIPHCVEQQVQAALLLLTPDQDEGSGENEYEPPCPDLQPIKELGRKLGYMITDHGSKKRDYDLIAVPWVETASCPEALIEAFKNELQFKIIAPADHKPAQKPHGRIALNMTRDRWEKHIDLSIVAPLPAPSEPWRPLKDVLADGFTHFWLPMGINKTPQIAILETKTYFRFGKSGSLVEIKQYEDHDAKGIPTPPPTKMEGS